MAVEPEKPEEDAEMAEAAAEAPAADAPEPELEQDEPKAKASVKRVTHEVAFGAFDATPGVFFSADTGVLAALSQGGLGRLVAAARADTGAKAGRYLFELQVLESAPGADSMLRVGFSAAQSSLFLGDGSADNLCFTSEGTYIVADPGQHTPFEKAGACRRMAPQQVIGVLLNLNQDGPNANTVSIFLDGQRAGPPQRVPAHLRGRSLFPTLNFRNLTLAVNFGKRRRQLKALPFSCAMLGELEQAHHERAKLPELPKGGSEVVLPVGLPEEGVFDFVEHFLEQHPNYQELSDRRVAEWCGKSGLQPRRAPGATHSRDRPDLASGHAQLDNRSWKPTLTKLAQLSGRSTIVGEVSLGMLKEERKELLSKFPPGTKKVAAVVVGEPSKAFKTWVHEKIKSDYETKKELVQRRIDLADASGDQLSEEDQKMPPEPELGDSVWLLPRSGDVPDVSEKAIGRNFLQFSLPTADEGFDEIRYEWRGKDEAEKHLQKWVQERKLTTLVEGLAPGAWFKGQLEAWHKLRQQLRQGHMAYSKRRASEGEDFAEPEPFPLADVVDIHNADGEGTPIYGGFRYEDWLLLSWRYELHLLVHAFLEDVGDAEREGIPEDQVPHYFQVYYGTTCEPKAKLGVEGLPAVLKLLKGPLELADHKGKLKILKAKLGKDAPPEAFVKDTELYRRDRARRVEAGDESARLSFPKPAPKAANGKAAPAKAEPAKAGPAKAVVTKASPAKVGPVVKSPALGKAPVAKSPAAKAPVAKTAPGAKRPLADEDDDDEEEAPKRPRTEGAAAPAKAPVAKTPAAKAPVTKSPVTKAPVTKAPVTKSPVTKAPVAKAPVAKRKP